jgi:predicted ATPase/DNA-binding winged helix-turn-helix (wHTH) protein
MGKSVFTFGQFELDAGRRVLTKNAVRIHLGSRATDVLIALVERAGVMIGAGQLTQLIWPDTFVDESNLRVHIAALRRAFRALGEDIEFIENLPGEGYRFTAPVTLRRRQSDTEDSTALRSPPPLTRLIGRADTIQDLMEDLPRHRLLTIVGTAGIGKTSIALAVGSSVEQHYEHGVCFVDLTSVPVDGQVVSVVASALHLPALREDVLGPLLVFLADKHLLLIFDNCEHHLDESATLVESILQASPKVAILTTSREPLGASGEWLRRLKALRTPDAHSALPAADALNFSAIQLFVERAQATSSSFRLTDEEAPSIADLCRQLDGLPLAIELAAARVDTLSGTDIAAQLRESIALLSRGRRTAQPRHRTLAGALDWSYELLSAEEQLIFARLSVFQSSFSREAALAVAFCSVMTPPKVMEALANLAAKSMVALDPGRDGPQYRLLDTTRTYASQKLGGGPAVDTVRRRHAEFLRDQQANYGASSVDAELPRDFRPLLHELRCALRWCFSANGDPLLGIDLTSVLASGWYAVSLFLEFGAQAHETLERLKNEGRIDPAMEMRLLLSFIPATYNTAGPTPEMHRAIVRALALANDETDLDRTCRLRLHKELWQYYDGTGEDDLALAAADEFGHLAQDDDQMLLLPRMRAVSYLNRGDLSLAQKNLDVVLAHPVQPTAIGKGIYEYDPQVWTLYTLARTLWLQGFPSRARHQADLCVRAAKDAQDPASLCLALALAACPIALWCGDKAAAQQSLESLREQAVACPLAYWQQFGDIYELALGRSQRKQCSMGPAACCHRQLQEASVLDGGWTAPELLQQTLDGSCQWFSAEVLRREALRRLELSGETVADEAEILLRRSLQLARQSGALSWELRTATSTAKLIQDRDPTAGHSLLQEVVSRFSEGYDTSDYMQALTVLSDLEDRLAKIMRVS